jgi:hypothetical protein
MKGLLELAAASIIGRKHLQTYQNNQDAYYSISNDSATIAIVCDGCSSGQHSEVGAKLGARLIAEAIAHYLPSNSTSIDTAFWEQVTPEVVKQLQQIAEMLAGVDSLPLIVNDYFLFTIVGAIITPLETVIFSVGDGVIALNNELKIIGEKYHNQPPYLAYHLCGHPEWAAIEIEYQLPTETVESILIGTDGVKDLIGAAHKLLPGKTETVGSIAQFWQQDRYFKNPDMIRRRLCLMNQNINSPNWKKQQIDKQVGLLPDDTTLIVMRKKLIHNC